MEAYGTGEAGKSTQEGRCSLTVIVPAYNEEAAIPLFYKTLTETGRAMQEAEIEMLFIDDGSGDRTLEVLRDLSRRDERVHYLSFSRNFGKESAIYAGLEHAKGDYAVIMDADLQDPPCLLPQMLDIVRTGRADCVGTRRVNRKGEPPVRSFFAKMFYRIMDKISHTEVVDGARDYQMMNRKVVDAILRMGEYHRFSKGIFGWVGFRKQWLEYENVERAAGETKWSFWKLFLYALDGIVAFSTAPLVLSSVLGIFFCAVALAAICIIIVKTLMFGDPTSGWPSLVCIIMLMSGVQLLCLGILGQYMAKTYLEVKRRPLYLVKEER